MSGATKQVEQISRIISRLTQLQGVCREIATKQLERAVAQGKTDLGYALVGQADAYADVAQSLKQVLENEDTVYHLSKEVDYLLVDELDPECTEEAISGEGLETAIRPRREATYLYAKHSPGSPGALVLGCRCPIVDNAHGRGCRGTEGPNALFIKSGDCPLHGKHTWQNHQR